MAMMLWKARGRVREVKPSATPTQVDGWINRRIQNVLDTRVWSDTMKFGMVIIPNATTAGTVSLAYGSNIVTGVGTGWPTNDSINTTITADITDAPGYVDINVSAATLAKLQPGSILLLDQENPSVTEIITVDSVGPATFNAYCANNHSSGVSLKQSSLAGQQFATDAFVYTVQAVLSSTSLQLDAPYGGQPQTAVSYMIRKEYVQISPTARFLKYAYDAIAGQSIGVDRDETWLIALDPQDQSTGNPLEMAMMHPAPGGVMQWRIWPYQTTQYAIGCLYQDGWPQLQYDTDLLPPFLNPEIIIAGAIADALRTKCIKSAGAKDDWYDPAMANSFWEPEYARLLEAATQSDQGRRMSYLTNYLEATQNACYNWMRSHAVGAGSGWGSTWSGSL